MLPKNTAAAGIWGPYPKANFHCSILNLNLIINHLGLEKVSKFCVITLVHKELDNERKSDKYDQLSG
jgi:hypothetical protein